MAKKKPTSKRKRNFRSIAYRKWRWAIYKRDNFTCQICKKVGGHLQAHHIISYSLRPDLVYDLSNGITLCKRCHRCLHKVLGKSVNSRKYLVAKKVKLPK